ncbi:MAG: ABC transporter permease [Candidatus Bathyarchaeota archaeon]|nr:MAG: ABC transporter permease [Candidatus Bathyarchaeota archaeon]
MLSELRNIIVKEVKELIRDPRILLGIILVPLLMFPLMGFMMRTSQEAAMESMKNLSVAIIDLDNDVFAQNLTEFLEVHGNLKVETLDASSINEVARYVQDSNITAVIVIPEDFSKNLTNRIRVELKVYGVFRGGGIAESGAFSAISSPLHYFEQRLVDQRLREALLDPDVVLNPIEISPGSVVKGEPVDVNPDTLFAVAMTQFIGFPLAIIMLIILAMQLAATSVASEKEEKTLETLLSLPISRFTLLMGKLTGSVIVAALGAIATIVGVLYYMGSITFGAATEMMVDLSAVGLAPGLFGYAVLGLSLFVSLLSALALAVVVSVFADDVRGAQSLLSFVYLPLFIPMLVLMFTDINALPPSLGMILLAIPFTHPMLAARAMTTGDYFTAIWGIGYVAIFTLVILYVAARIFATEKILTMQLRLRRRKMREE